MVVMIHIDGETREATPEEETALAAIVAVGSPPDIDAYRLAIQGHVDSVARQRAYDSGITCASYVGSTNEAWAAEAQAFVAWRDDVWTYAYAELGKVETGERPQPSVDEILSELPALTWPA